MDPVSVLADALSVGGAAGISATAATAVKDAYAEFKSVLARRIAGNKAAEVAVEHYVADQETWSGPLAKTLSGLHLTEDEIVVVLARQFLAMTAQGNIRSPTAIVDSRGAHTVQVGDHNREIHVQGNYIEGNHIGASAERHKEGLNG